MLTVTVRNGAGLYAMDLHRDAFEVTDEKEVRSVEFFEASDTPVSVGILIDTSSSMQAIELLDVTRAKSLSEAFAKFFERSNADNEYFLAAFDGTPRFLTDWLSGQEVLAKKIELVRERHDTAIFDACISAIEKLNSGRHARKVIILVSDGQDNASRHTYKELLELLKRSEVMFYSVGIHGPADAGSALGMEAEGMLRDLSQVTGAEPLFVKNRKELNTAIEVIASQLHHQYRIGMRSANDSPQKWHRIKLTVTAPANAAKEFSKLKARTRQGYYPRS